MAGVYSEFGDLRKMALQLAIESADDFRAEEVVARAESYYLFLLGDS